MKHLIVALLTLLSVQIFSQDIAVIKVNASETGNLDCPVSISLDQLDYNEDAGKLILAEKTGQGEVPIPVQLEPGHSARLWFILSGKTPAGAVREFVLRKQGVQDHYPAISLHKSDGKLKLSRDEKQILAYQYRMVYPSEGINPLYKRSGFIHPLWSPGGQVLTRIQAPDHYHHYGIWGPWTKTHIGRREVDFWNLAKGQGTVKFSGFMSESEGPVFSGFKALQEHIDFGARGEDRVAMTEVLDVRVWNTGNEDFWLVEYTTTLNTPLDTGIMLDAYRYGGGIGYRATEVWHKDNSSVLTSEGKDRLEADGTKARWCRVEGESATEEGRSGIVFMGHPSNREFPEPMRVWPVNQNGRGDLYFEFCPIRHNDWKLDRGRDYTLRYRLLVFDGVVSEEEAELHWHSFANPPRVEVITADQ